MQKTNLGYFNPGRTRVSLCSVNKALVSVDKAQCKVPIAKPGDSAMF